MDIKLLLNVTKSDLLGQLTNAKNNFLLSLTSSYLLQNHTSLAVIQGLTMKIEDKDFDLNQVINMLSNTNDAKIVLQEYYMMGYRVFYREPFQLIRSYVKIDTPQEQLLKNSDWYDFARMIRNSVSHDFNFTFSEYDKTLLPLTWKNLTIDLSMEHMPLTMTFYGFSKSLEMFDEMISFVQNKLS